MSEWKEAEVLAKEEDDLAKEEDDLAKDDYSVAKLAKTQILKCTIRRYFAGYVEF